MIDYQKRLSEQSRLSITYKHISLSKGPANHSEIYESIEPILRGIFEESGIEMTYFISPGTSQMASIWLVMGKTKYPGKFVQSSTQTGVEDVEIPFDLAADYLPDLKKTLDEEINRIAAGGLPVDPAFENFIATGKAMKNVIRLAQQVASRSIALLIEGNPGTGKGLLAQCIHHASGRQKFIEIDCAAYSEEQLETELFGSEGAFSQTEESTLYLARLEELPVKLQLRLIHQLSSFDAEERLVRLIASADTTLRDEVKAGKFRQELYFRLTAANFYLPDVRKRGGDISQLINHFFSRINEFNVEQTGAKPKVLSAGARRILLDHSWPGNVTELINTIQRAVLWTETATIRETDMRDAILEPILKDSEDAILDRDIDNGIDLQGVIKEVKAHYLSRAWKDSGFNKKRTAQILGLKNYQTASNWLEEFKIG